MNGILIIFGVLWVTLWGIIGYLTIRHIIKRRREDQAAQAWMMSHPFGYLSTHLY